MNDEPRQKLRELIIEHGRSLCNDSNRCEALLKDYCGVHKREIFVLMSALKKRVTDDLLQSSASVPQEIVLERLRKRLEDELAITGEAAHWAVESWALALGFVSVVTPRPKVVLRPQTVSVSDVKKVLIPNSQEVEFILGGRYRDNYDGTITDVKTRLQWMRFSMGQEWKSIACLGTAILYKLQEAIRAAESINKKGGYAGHSDWRIPTKDELMSIVYLSSGTIVTWGDSGSRPPAKYDTPTIYQPAFPATPLRRYWSCTSYAAGLNSSWFVDFNNGLATSSSRSTDCALRLVRVGI